MTRTLFTALLLGSAILPVAALGPGCATPDRKIMRSSEASRGLLFPYGVYRHQVRVELSRQPASGPREFGFRGLAQIRSDVIRIAVLSPFNTTLMKLTEDRKTGAITTETYSAAFRKLEPRIREYYSTLRLLLTLPLPVAGPGLTVTSLTRDGFPAELKAEQATGESVIRFGDYDPHRVPGTIEIASPRYTVRIQVAAYEI